MFSKIISWLKQEVKCGDRHVFRYRFLGAMRGWDHRPIEGLPCQCGKFKDYSEYKKMLFIKSLKKL